MTTRTEAALQGMLIFAAMIKDAGDHSMKEAVQGLSAAEKATQHVDQFSNVVRSIAKV